MAWRRVLITFVAVVLAQAAPVSTGRAETPAGTGEVDHGEYRRTPVNVELGHVWNSGVINEGQPSTAFHLGVSGASRISLHSSLDFGFLEFDRRKYLRFSMVGFGYQPQTGRDHGVDGFARTELACLSVGETGYYALTPSIEIGGTAHFDKDWALIAELRQALDLTNVHAALTSVFFGLLLAD